MIKQWVAKRKEANRFKRKTRGNDFSLANFFILIILYIILYSVYLQK